MTQVEPTKGLEKADMLHHLNTAISLAFESVCRGHLLKEGKKTLAPKILALLSLKEDDLFIKANSVLGP